MVTHTETSYPGRAKRAHLIGIGGSGISAIAHVLLERGWSVSGSDRQASTTTAALAAAGATIYLGHAAEQVEGAELVIRSSAIPDENPEVVAALAAGRPVLKRADFLGSLMAAQVGIAVAGTHGKTTTTGMIAHILMETGLDPSLIVGGDLPGLDGNGRSGSGPHFVVEADEYDHMFLGLRPTIGVITNIEHDHPDIFPTEAEYLAAYLAFVDLIPTSGRLIICGDDPGNRALLSRLDLDLPRTVYGLGQGPLLAAPADRLEATGIGSNQRGGNDFDVELNGELLGRASLELPGRHNIQNGLAAIGASLCADLPFKKIAKALASFRGMGRRFEIVGEAKGITIIDDYAHHPTEIAATLEAARERFPQGRIWAVWQPHTFSRTRLLFDRFRHCFAAADRVIQLAIYRSRETNTLGLTGSGVAGGIEHPAVEFISRREEAVTHLLDQLEEGDVVIILNAGDATEMGGWLLSGLQPDIQEINQKETITSP